MIDISVIVPTYKPEAFLRECIEALDRQSLDHSRFEVLVILNGPRDPYLAQIENYVGEHPNLICRIIYNKEKGVSNARNRGLDEACGEYICFVDGDDLVTENYLQELLSLASPEIIPLPYVCAFDDGTDLLRPIYISEDFKENEKDIPFAAAKRYFYVCWGKLIYRDVIGNRRFDATLSNGEDCQFMLLISNRIRKASFTNRNVKYMYRQRSDSAFYGNKSVWYHFSNMLIRLYKATKVYVARPACYSFRFYSIYMLATFMGGIRQMLHRKQ